MPSSQRLALIVVLLILSGCGSRQSHDELVKALEAPVPRRTAAVGPASTSNDTASSAGDGQSSPVVAGSSGGDTSTQGSQGSATDGDTFDPGTAGASAGSGTIGCARSLAPIVIGSVGEQSGFVGAQVADGPKAVRAWIAAVNARGGIACHPVKYVVADDGGDPSRHQALVQQLVEQDHVIAFVHMNAPLPGRAALEYLTARGIPVVGNEGSSSWFYDSPMYFPQAPSAELLWRATIASLSTVAVAAGATNLALMSCIESTGCSSINAVAPGYAADYGMRLVYQGSVSVAQPDYTSACQSAQRSGANALIVILDGNGFERAVKSCRSIGFNPIVGTASSVTLPRMESNAQLDGLVVGMTVAPWMATNLPSIVDYQDALHQFAPGLPLDATTIAGWVSAKLFERAAANVSDPPTSASILDGLWSLQDDDLGGLTAPLTFPRGQTAPRTFCYWVVQLTNGAFTTPNNGARTCA